MSQKKYFILLLKSIMLMLVISCGNNTDKNNKDKNQNTVDTVSKSQKTVQPVAYTLDTLSINDVTFNNQKVLIPNTEFNQYFKVDSSKSDVWECGDPFTYLDKEWMEKTYGKFDPNKGTYKNFDGKITTFFVGNTQFSSNNNKVLFGESKAKGNKLSITNNSITLDENTTLEDFKKIFPKATIDPAEEPGEQVARISADKIGGDFWIFNFKNSKLNFYTLFWDLC